jgi:hypothetical protein
MPGSQIRNWICGDCVLEQAHTTYSKCAVDRDRDDVELASPDLYLRIVVLSVLPHDHSIAMLWGRSNFDPIIVQSKGLSRDDLISRP